VKDLLFRQTNLNANPKHHQSVTAETGMRCQYHKIESGEEEAS